MFFRGFSRTLTLLLETHKGFPTLKYFLEKQKGFWPKHPFRSLKVFQKSLNIFPVMKSKGFPEKRVKYTLREKLLGDSINLISKNAWYIL
jgi:hypothetical protein